MKHDLYEMPYPTPLTGEILKELRSGIAKNFGVTLTGNRLTIRWNKNGKLVEVHTIIDYVDDGEGEIENE